MPGILPDRQFYSDVAGTLGRGLANPDLYKGFAKEATLGLLGLPGDLGWLMGNAPAVVSNWREGRPLDTNLGDPLDHPLTSDAMAARLGIPYTGSGAEQAGRVLGGVLDVGALAGGLRAISRADQARGLADMPIQPSTTVGRNQAGAIGYHGSPHQFDEFDLSKVGTGEGAQVKGHGVYIAESPDVGQIYKGATAYKDIVRQFRNELPDDADFSEVMAMVNRGEFSEDKAKFLRELAKDDWLGFDHPSQAISAALSEAVKPVGQMFYDMSDGLKSSIDDLGSFYKVDIPDEHVDQMLDWDAPVTQNMHTTNEQLDAIFNKIGIGPNNPARETMTGEDAHKLLVEELGGQVKAAEFLRKQGIPGIKYFDAGSRKAGKGTRNYVVFDDKSIKIKERNNKPVGLLGEIKSGQRGAIGLLGDGKSTDLFKTWKRNKKTGQYVGAPPGTTKPAQVGKHIKDYAARVRAALEDGVHPGYFYDEGAKAIRAVARNDAEAHKFARTNAITSSEAPVENNVGWAIKAHEQNAMGVPIHTGKYPNQERANLESVLQGANDLNIGKDKRELYGIGLHQGSAGNPSLAPNDRWEISSVFGADKKTATDQQHQYMHTVREGARKQLQAEGIDLSPLEAQELNWTVAKANAENKTPRQVAEGETVQSSLPKYTYKHTWESDPGAPEHFANMDPALKNEFHGLLRNEIIDSATGKDRLIEGLGGEFQLPAYDGPGVYKGNTNPGTTSQSLVYQKGREVDPTSFARLEGTEATRALMLGQEGYAGNLVLPAKASDSKASLDAVSVRGLKLDDATAKKVDALMRKKFPDGEYGPTFAITNEADGFSILNLGNEKFADKFKELTPFLEEALGDKAKFEFGRQAQSPEGGSLYGELDWEGNNAAAGMLGKLDNPDAPGLLARADSPQVRGVAGNVARAYEAFQKAGHGIPYDRLINVLKTWESQGIEGVRAMVKAGTAPVAAIAILSELANRQDPEAA